MKSVPQDGVRTFLPPSHLAMTKPAITRPARRSHYTPENARHLCLFRTEMKLTIRPMRVHEAKDFLVAQTAEQAALEGVPLSDLEKRMMYFTESGYVPEDPIKLNEEFEAECDSDEYEAKVSRLLHHAYRRLQKENDAVRKNWNLAIKCLRRGDHYLLVMWDMSSSTEWSAAYFLKILAGSLGLIFLMFLVVLAKEKLEPQLGWLKEASQTHWRVLFGIFITIFLAVFFFPLRVGIAAGWLMDHALSRFLGPKEDEKDSE